MCGIVGYVGTREAVPRHRRGAAAARVPRLRLRGRGGGAGRRDARAGASVGKLKNLEESLRRRSRWPAPFGIGHTRWATHGRPSEENAHPHRDCKGKIVVVHNGIIENYLAAEAAPRRRGPQASSPRPTPRSSPTSSRVAVARATSTDAVRAARRRSWKASTRSSCSCTRTSRRSWSARARARRWWSASGEGEHFLASDIPALLRLHARRSCSSRTATWRVRATPCKVTDLVGARRSSVSRAAAHRLGPRAGGEGRLPPLHAQGDPRAAARGRATRCSAASASRRARSTSRSWARPRTSSSAPSA